MVEEVVTVHRFRVQRSGLRKKKAMKAPRSRADGATGYRNNVYYIAAPLGGISASLQQAVGIRP